MNTERLLKHYERIADAPDAIARLRRFVFDLAVRGKLVPQDPKDEPASELLKRIEKEKARLVKAGEIKLRKTMARDHNEPLDFQLPAGWELTDLGSVALKITDGAHKTPTYVERGVPFVSVKDFSAGKLDLSNTRFIPECEHEALYQRCDPRRGDILLGRIGTLGKAVLVDTDVEFSLFVSVGMIRFDHASINPDFFRVLLNSPVIEREFDRIKIGGGTHTNKLNLGDLYTVAHPLPPLAEQHRIVVKVDELMALCDRLEVARAEREATRDRLTAASLARLNAPDPETFKADARFALDAVPALTARPDQIKQLRQTILNLAVRGKLVPQDPNDEPASELLKRIALEKAGRVKQGTLREPKPLPPIKEEETEFDLGAGWQWVRMADVIKLWNGFAFKSSDFQPTGVPVIRIGDLQGGEVTLSAVVYVPDVVARTVSAEVWIPPGALLIAMSGATTGKTAFNRTGLPLLLNQRVGRIEVFLISVDFIRFFFETIVARNLSISSGTAIPNLSAQQINETIIPLPPLSEQHRIVAKVDELMALCDRLEASLTSGDDTRRRLLDALLAEALVPAKTAAMEAVA